MARPFTSSHDSSRWRFWPGWRTAESERAEPEAITPVSQRLEITCCGAFNVQYGGRVVTFIRSRKARELLAFLATRPGMTASCDEAVAALWPDAEPDRARRLLINAAWRSRCGLRDASIGEAGVAASALRFDHDRYTLDGRLCTCDLARYRTEHARYETYLRPYGAGADDVRQMLAEAQRLLEIDTCVEALVLAGETYAWLSVLERQIRELRLSGLRRALRLASRGAAQELALSIAERILTLDALDEPTVALALRLRLARGDSASAATIYRAFRLTLARRYGSAAPTLAQPSQELQALFAQAVGRDSASRESAPSPPASSPPAQAHGPPPSRTHLQ